jgi:hypothetical protein
MFLRISSASDPFSQYTSREFLKLELTHRETQRERERERENEVER